MMKSMPLDTKYDHFILVSFSLENNHRELLNSLSLQYIMCLQYVICHVHSILDAWYGTRSLLLNPENRDVFPELAYKYQLVIILINFITQWSLVQTTKIRCDWLWNLFCHVGEESRHSLAWFKSLLGSICNKHFFASSSFPTLTKPTFFSVAWWVLPAIVWKFKTTLNQC